MVLAEILTQLPMSQWASKSQATSPECVTKKCSYGQWVLRRFDEWKLSKVHCLRKYPRNVTYYIIAIIVISITCCCPAAKGTVLASQDGVCSCIKVHTRNLRLTPLGCFNLIPSQDPWASNSSLNWSQFRSLLYHLPFREVPNIKRDNGRENLFTKSKASCA